MPGFTKEMFIVYSVLQLRAVLWKGTRKINDAVRFEYFMMFNFQEYWENTSHTRPL